MTDQIATGYWLTHEELEAIKAEARADEVGKVVEWLRAESAMWEGRADKLFYCQDQPARHELCASQARAFHHAADTLASGKWKETR